MEKQAAFSFPQETPEPDPKLSFCQTCNALYVEPKEVTTSNRAATCDAVMVDLRALQSLVERLILLSGGDSFEGYNSRRFAIDARRSIESAIKDLDGARDMFAVIEGAQ